MVVTAPVVRSFCVICQKDHDSPYHLTKHWNKLHPSKPREFIARNKYLQVCPTSKKLCNSCGQLFTTDYAKARHFRKRHAATTSGNSVDLVKVEGFGQFMFWLDAKNVASFFGSRNQSTQTPWPVSKAISRVSWNCRDGNSYPTGYSMRDMLQCPQDSTQQD